MKVRLIITGQPLTNSLKREPELGGGERGPCEEAGVVAASQSGRMFCSTGSSASISDSRYEMTITLSTDYIAIFMPFIMYTLLLYSSIHLLIHPSMYTKLAS